jgi:hypothetical protein
VRHGEGLYAGFASIDSLQCFECGHLGHKSFALIEEIKVKVQGVKRCRQQKLGLVMPGKVMQMRLGLVKLEMVV